MNKVRKFKHIPPLFSDFMMGIINLIFTFISIIFFILLLRMFVVVYRNNKDILNAIDTIKITKSPIIYLSSSESTIDAIELLKIYLSNTKNHDIINNNTSNKYSNSEYSCDIHPFYPPTKLINSLDLATTLDYPSNISGCDIALPRVYGVTWCVTNYNNECNNRDDRAKECHKPPFSNTGRNNEYRICTPFSRVFDRHTRPYCCSRGNNNSDFALTNNRVCCDTKTCCYPHRL